MIGRVVVCGCVFVCSCVRVFVCLENKTKEKGRKETKKREELECVRGVISRKITRNQIGMYVRGVAIVASGGMDIDRSIDR